MGDPVINPKLISKTALEEFLANNETTLLQEFMILQEVKGVFHWLLADFYWDNKIVYGRMEVLTGALIGLNKLSVNKVF